MEIILGLVVLAVVGYFVFFRKSAEAGVAETTPYKVETVEAQSAVVEQARQVVAESVAPAKKPRATAVKKAPAAKKPAKKVVTTK